MTPKQQVYPPQGAHYLHSNMYPAGKPKGLPSINAGLPLSLSADKFPNARSKSTKKYYDTYMNGMGT